MFEDYYFTTAYDGYYPPAQAAAAALDRIDGELDLASYLEQTEVDIRSGVSEVTSYVLNENAQDPSNTDTAILASFFNALTPNLLTSIVYLVEGAQDLVSDYLANNPDFITSTSNVRELIADAEAASRIGIGLEYFRPQDLPPLVVDLAIPSFDFSAFQINPALSFDFDFSTGFDFGSDFSSDFNFDFDFSFDFEFDDYWNFVDYFGET